MFRAVKKGDKTSGTKLSAPAIRLLPDHDREAAKGTKK